MVLIVRGYFEAITRGAAIPGRKETFSYSWVQPHKRRLRRGQTPIEADKRQTAIMYRRLQYPCLMWAMSGARCRSRGDRKGIWGWEGTTGPAGPRMMAS